MFVCQLSSMFDLILFSAASTHARNAKVGFIGLGNMGGPMAENLISKVGAYHLNPKILAVE